MGGFAKAAVLLGAGGGVSAVVTPVVLVAQNHYETFKFTDINGKKETVTLECEPKEGEFAYPKVDLSKKVVTCDYSSSKETIKEHWREVALKFIGTLNCSNVEGRDDDKKCHVSKFEKKERGLLTYVE
ncbi:hypothetical protein MHLP_02785 [Candidatus Mycoplasma haematolamae str. Purdue]|uniref:Uncharacterized protein n=1 Tax=Mycoplasma haematolamae (strain Purdue) TaxID=1212765 RepID=I7C6J1_MYCHA|nr:hypothetical protein [Candidatus Mycoplasma haematolamae]AFO52137.1 hypothetical protein MHLP_02785 [Candidatus Mycoplasma haematolamae str. Purdue]